MRATRVPLLLPLLAAGLLACDAGDGLPGADLGLDAVAEAGDPGRDAKDPRDVKDPGAFDPGDGDEGPGDLAGADGEDFDLGPLPDAVDDAGWADGSTDGDLPADAAGDAGDGPDGQAADGAGDTASGDAAPEAGEPVPESPEPLPEAAEPAPEFQEPTPDVAEPSPEVVEPRPDVAEPAPEVVEPAPEVVEPPPDVPEPAPDVPDVVDVPDVADPGPDAPDPRCDRVHRWGYVVSSDVPQDAGACLTYVPDGNYDATWCEFWLDDFAEAYYAHYGLPFRWLEGRLQVAPAHVDGTVLDAGMWVLYRDVATQQQDWLLSMGTEIAPGRFEVGVTTQHTGYMGEGSYERAVEKFAFFLDVQRPGGTIDRLWQSRFGTNWTLEDAFTLPTTPQSIPYGTKSWSDQASAVFDPKRGCGL